MQEAYEGRLLTAAPVEGRKEGSSLNKVLSQLNDEARMALHNCSRVSQEG
jgi:hypothetical protein